MTTQSEKDSSSQIKWIMGIIAALIVAMAMAWGASISGSIQSLSDKATINSANIEGLKEKANRFDAIDKRLERIENKLDDLTSNKK